MKMTHACLELILTFLIPRPLDMELRTSERLGRLFAKW